MQIYDNIFISQAIFLKNVPQATYFKSEGFCIVAEVAKGQYILTRYGWDGEGSLIR